MSRVAARPFGAASPPSPSPPLAAPPTATTCPDPEGALSRVLSKRSSSRHRTSVAPCRTMPVSCTRSTTRKPTTPERPSYFNARTMCCFRIPTASLPVIPLVFMTALIPLYDRAFVPLMQRLTGIPTGIRHLQRIGIGLVLSAASMAVVESRQKAVATKATRLVIVWRDRRGSRMAGSERAAATQRRVSTLAVAGRSSTATEGRVREETEEAGMESRRACSALETAAEVMRVLSPGASPPCATPLSRCAARPYNIAAATSLAAAGFLGVLKEKDGIGIN